GGVPRACLASAGLRLRGASRLAQEGGGGGVARYCSDALFTSPRVRGEDETDAKRRFRVRGSLVRLSLGWARQNLRIRNTNIVVDDVPCPSPGSLSLADLSPQGGAR